MGLTTQFESALRELIQDALKECNLTSAGRGNDSVTLEIPKIRSHGDLATSVALQVASRQKRPPLQIAELLSKSIRSRIKDSSLKEGIGQIEVKPPGFINFFLSPAFFYQLLEEVLESGSNYGRSSVGKGQRAMVEFVSANPTGPLSVAHGRQAAIGDALANILDFAGYQVRREYYLNDEGTQIDLLGASIIARAKGAAGGPSTFPENGYKGQYVRDLGRLFLEQGLDLESTQAQEEARRFGVKELSNGIRGELDRFGVRFDDWFPQSSLGQKRYLEESLDLLKAQGYLYESEGAWWLKSTAFGDDKDRVVIRSDGRLTYIASDIAYHRKKFERGFQFLVNLWGPDHHGYIPRLKAAVQALGFPADALQIRIVQLCTLKRGAETIPMSTREGQFITLEEVMKEVGVDAARFFFLLRKMDAHLEFDLELAKQHSLENPVYYIQYAYARIVRILENWKEKGLPEDSKGTYSKLSSTEEIALLRLLREFPGAIETSARVLEPFGIVSYLHELAEAFHRFYDAHRVIGDDLDVSRARLDLIKAVQSVLSTGLRLLGVSAPEKM